MYDYQTERPKLFTDKGSIAFTQMRDHVRELLKTSGAFDMSHAINGSNGGGDSWEIMARVDRLVELGEIREISTAGCAGQHRVFIARDR